MSFSIDVSGLGSISDKLRVGYKHMIIKRDELGTISRYLSNNRTDGIQECITRIGNLMSRVDRQVNILGQMVLVTERAIELYYSCERSVIQQSVDESEY